MPKDGQPLLKVQGLCYQNYQKLRFASTVDRHLPLSDRENYKIVNKRLFAGALQVNIDFEFILDRTRDNLDYSFILKHFTRKWSSKYADPCDKNIMPLQLSDMSRQG